MRKLTEEELDQALKKFARKLRKEHGIQVEYRITLNVKDERLDDEEDGLVYAIVSEIIEEIRQEIHRILREHLTLSKVVRVTYEDSNSDI